MAWVLSIGIWFIFESSVVVYPVRSFLKESMKSASSFVSIRSRIQKSIWFSCMPPGILRGILSVHMRASFMMISRFSGSSQW